MEKYDLESILDKYDDDYQKVAEVPRSEMDNFNTPDLEQAPDSYLKPGETLEDFDVTFRRPNADGGRIPFAKAKSVQKKPEPAKYITGNELFETLPISKKDYFRLKYKGGSLLTDTIDNLLKPKKITVPGRPDEVGFKKPTKEQIETFQKISSRKGRLKPDTVELMLEFDKKFSNAYTKGNLPDLKTVQKFFPDVTPTTAGNVTVRLSQWYNGTDFLNPELQKIKRNKTKAKNIQKASSTTRYGNFYSDQAYKVALDTIDETIGRQVGSFKAFKDNIKTALKDAGLPIYSKNSPFGFNLNEMAGVTGASRTKTAAFSDFVDIAEGNFNQKQLSRFQKDFAELREKLDNLNLSKNPQNQAKAKSLIDDFKKVTKYYEGQTGSTLPKIGLGTAEKYYSPERLESISKPKKVGETGKKLFRDIPGTDLIKASKNAGYTVIVPENYRTVGEIMETGGRGEIRKNVENTLEGMKKFFNEYDEKKMFKKLQNASPDVLKKMMKVIPKVVSLEDDFLNAYGYPLTAGLESNIGVQPIKEEGNFITRNPYTSAATTIGAMLPFKKGRQLLGKGINLGFGPTGILGINAYLGIDPTSGVDRTVAATEAALLPQAVKGALSVTDKIKNPLLKKGLETLAGVRIPGIMTPANALRLARFTSPLGIASLGLEGLYQIAKLGYEDQQRFNALSPEEQAAERAEQEAFAQSIEGA